MLNTSEFVSEGKDVFPTFRTNSHRLFLICSQNGRHSSNNTYLFISHLYFLKARNLYLDRDVFIDRPERFAKKMSRFIGFPQMF